MIVYERFRFFDGGTKPINWHFERPDIRTSRTLSSFFDLQLRFNWRRDDEIS